MADQPAATQQKERMAAAAQDRFARKTSKWLERVDVQTILHQYDKDNIQYDAVAEA